jgi:hypothetical protein
MRTLGPSIKRTEMSSRIKTQSKRLALASLVVLSSSLVFAAVGTEVDQSKKAMDIAVIADVPYGDHELAAFQDVIDELNSDDKVRLVIHLGDIKNGRSSCSDEWFELVAELFDTFEDPLVYSIGDNEWTDCHRENNDSWDPVERLSALRDLFFGSPGVTLGGRSKAVYAQVGYPENQLWFESGVAFSALHVVGSNNNYRPGTCYPVGSAGCPTGNEAETAAQAAARTDEADARVAANAIWLAETFDLADEQDAVGIALFIQADMWFREDTWGFDSFKDTLTALAAGFDGPIMLINGDSHNFAVNLRPELGDNVTQITVDATIEDDVEWLRLTVDPREEAVFGWERVISE